MKIPILSKWQLSSLERFSALSDDELYAMIGRPLSYEVFHTTKDTLGFKAEIRVTKAAIERGKTKIRKIIDNNKEELCRKWTEIKRQHSGKIEDIITIALIIEVMRPFIIKEFQEVPPIVAIAELVWRAAGHSLDKFCAQSK